MAEEREEKDRRSGLRQLLRKKPWRFLWVRKETRVKKREKSRKNLSKKSVRLN
jgi:hypothetical protein